MGAGEITGLTNRSLQLLNPASRLVGKKKRQRDSGNDQRRTDRDYRNRAEGKMLKYVGINPRNRTQLYYSTVKRCRECSQKGRCTRGKEYAESKKPEDEKAAAYVIAFARQGVSARTNPDREAHKPSAARTLMKD